MTLTDMMMVVANGTVSEHTVEFALGPGKGWLFALFFLPLLIFSAYVAFKEEDADATLTFFITFATAPLFVLLISLSSLYFTLDKSSTITSDIAPYSLVEKSQVEKVFEAELGDDIEFHAETESNPSLFLSGDDYDAEAQEYRGEYIVSDVGDRSIRNYELRVSLDGEAIIEETSTDADQPAD